MVTLCKAIKSSQANGGETEIPFNLAPLDPRPELQKDSELWELLLLNAWVLGDEREGDPNSLYGALHGLRCGGARLVVINDGQCRIISGDWGTEEYERLRDQYLKPHHAELVKLLTWLGEYWGRRKA